MCSSRRWVSVLRHLFTFDCENINVGLCGPACRICQLKSFYSSLWRHYEMTYVSGNRPVSLYSLMDKVCRALVRELYHLWLAIYALSSECSFRFFNFNQMSEFRIETPGLEFKIKANKFTFNSLTSNSFISTGLIWNRLISNVEFLLIFTKFFVFLIFLFMRVLNTPLLFIIIVDAAWMWMYYILE